MAIPPLRYEHEGAVLQKTDQVPLSFVGDEQGQERGRNEWPPGWGTEKALKEVALCWTLKEG